MFNVELIEEIIKLKNEEIQSLQANQPTAQENIDNLTKEVAYLNAMIVRYKIAKLLKLDTNPSYISINFLGIEEEDVNDFNLTREELAEYNSLINQLPQDQLQRFKLRRHISEVLPQEISDTYKGNSYEGIEKINPDLTKYGLTQEQIQKFKDLVSDLSRLSTDTTKSVDISSETIRLLKEAFDKLNIEDVAEYNRIKTTYLETIDKLMKYIDEDSKKDLFTGVSSYELSKDLKEKYPEMTVQLDIKGVENLLKLLESGTLDNDKYDELINVLCSNINNLYKDDSNKEKIENLLNSVYNNNYILRSDLNSKLSIENIKLGLTDDEFPNFLEVFDKNYASYNERTRDKYFELIRSKISENNNDLNIVTDLNKLLSKISNKELSARLQKAFASNQDLNFSNKHLNSYDELLQSSINALKKQKSIYEGKKSHSKNKMLITRYDTKIKEIEKSIEKIEKMGIIQTENSLLGKLDSKYNDKNTKIIAIKKEIEDLQKLKAELTGHFQQHMLDRKIASRNKKVAKLQKSKNKIVGVQKKIMAPKLWLDKRKGKVERHFEAKKEVYEEYTNQYQNMAEIERQFNGMFSGIKASFYDFKAKRYNNKAEFNSKICEKLKNSKVTVTGRNRHMINKNTLAQIKQAQQQALNQHQPQLTQTAA